MFPLATSFFLFLTCSYLYFVLHRLHLLSSLMNWMLLEGSVVLLRALVDKNGMLLLIRLVTARSSFQKSCTVLLFVN